MVTGFEALLVKPLVDAVKALFAAGKNRKLRKDAEKTLDEAFKLLLLAPNDLHDIEAKMAVVEAAKLMSPKRLVAEDILEKHRKALGKPPAKKAAAKKAAAKKAPAKKAAAKKAPAKKAAAKKAPAKKAAAR